MIVLVSLCVALVAAATAGFCAGWLWRDRESAGIEVSSSGSIVRWWNIPSRLSREEMVSGFEGLLRRIEEQHR